MSEVAAHQIAAVGASAGGLEALERFFRNVPDDTGLAFVVVQHLSAQHKSMMVELLGRHTELPVLAATDGVMAAPNTVWLIPPGHDLEIEEGRLRLRDRVDGPALHLPIDTFFESLARDYGGRSIGVILSGTGSDGTRGIRAIKEAGGYVIIQTPTSARFDGMPVSAVATGLSDLVCPPEEMGAHLAHLASGGVLVAPAATGDDDDADDGTIDLATLERITELLRAESGVDFSRYKRNTVMRRIARRIAINRLTSVEDYVALLRASSDERDALFNELLIGVTRFFRDGDLFDQVREQIIRPLIQSTGGRETLRIWVPGCSSGEEVYTLAMLVHEELEHQQRSVDVRIFGSDIDRNALERAARGVYPEAIAADLTPERAALYFEPDGQNLEVSRILRRMVLFVNHDVTRDPPFTRLDLVSCRNMLIYLDVPEQQRVLSAFHFALKPERYLLLGTSETVGDLANHFDRVNPGLRAYRAVGEHPRLMPSAAGLSARTEHHRPAANRLMGVDATLTAVQRATESLIGQYSPPALLVDDNLRILHIFGDAGAHLHMGSGTPALDALRMTKGATSAVLATGIPRVLRSGEPALYRSVRTTDDSEAYTLRILPVPGNEPGRSEVLVLFEPDEGVVGADVDGMTVDEDVEHYLTALQAELQRARESQQLLVEELGTSNEELQASNEELLASNEELQATNEELQATNEELHSVNEELHTVNAEYEQKIGELEELSSDLDNLLVATDIGTLFLDDRLTIRRFTPSVAEVLPMLDRDIGRPIAHLSNELGGDDFVRDLQEVLITGVSRERQMETRRGPLLVRMLPYKALTLSGVVVTFVNLKTVTRSYEIAQRVLDELPSMVAVLDPEGRIMLTNHRWMEAAEQTGLDEYAAAPGGNFFKGIQGRPYTAELESGVRSVITGAEPHFWMEFSAGDTDERWMEVTCQPVHDGNSVITFYDVTVQKVAEMRLQHLATTDPLTGVLNRRGLDGPLEQLLGRFNRTGEPVGVIMIDCDDFKDVNDRLGHAAGDVMLMSLARRVEDHLRGDDVVARIGGDEFLVLLPEANQVEAGLIAERIRLAVAAEPVAVAHDTLRLTVSMAVTMIDGSVRSLEDVLVRCRFALSSSKKRGKNRVTYAHGDQELSLADDGVQRAVLRLVREDGALEVVAQPIVRLSDSGVVAVELLSRCAQPPFLSPETFFRAATEDGMLTALDERCLEACLKACMQLPEGVTCHINVYPSTLLAMPVERVREIINGTRGDRLCFELSEQQILGDPSYLLEHLAALRAIGAKVAIDDIGFGRTSLESLIVLEPEIIKIDRAYVKDIAKDEHRLRWLRRLTRTARSLDATIIAEGVESAADAACLSDLGISLAQGHLYAQAGAVADITVGASSPG